eukprot:5184928-Pyramimonas_sp.AAC.1
MTQRGGMTLQRATIRACKLYLLGLRGRTVLLLEAAVTVPAEEGMEAGEIHGVGGARAAGSAFHRWKMLRCNPLARCLLSV